MENDTPGYDPSVLVHGVCGRTEYRTAYSFSIRRCITCGLGIATSDLCGVFNGLWYRGRGCSDGAIGLSCDE